MRLDKYLCNCGQITITRSQAKNNIRFGAITINGNVVTDAKTQVKTNDQVCFNGKPIGLMGLRYIMLNKPADYISSTTDEQHPSLIRLIDVEKPELLHIAGRLDVDTTGLALITDDGQWSHDITSPNKKKGKRYRLTVENPLTQADIDQFKQGIMLRGEAKATLPAELTIVSDHEAVVVLHEGRYHQIKRMFAAVGNKVTTLHREAVAHIALDPALAPGQWRYLTDAEINPKA